MDFTVIQGDIADQSADALVNAAGTSLRMGSGVAGALRRWANGPINEAAMAKGLVDLGEVAVTEGFDLDATYVIHAAAMPHYGDGRATVSSVRTAARNALAAADERGCESVVAPILGTGAAGLAFADGARTVCETLATYEPATLDDVRLIAYDQGQFDRLRAIADDINTA